MNKPKEYNFLPHYSGDARKPLSMTFNYPRTGNPVLIKSARMQLRNFSGDIFYEFSSDPGKNELLEIEGNKLLFQKHKKWKMIPNVYLYDLEITDMDGSVMTVIKGKWEILKDITR